MHPTLPTTIFAADDFVGFDAFGGPSHIDLAWSIAGSPVAKPTVTSMSPSEWTRANPITVIMSRRLGSMENVRITRVMFRTIAALGMFLFVAAAHTRGREPAIPALADQPETLTVPAGDTRQLSPKGHPYPDPEVLSEYGLVTFIDREKPDAPRRI